MDWPAQPTAGAGMGGRAAALLALGIAAFIVLALAPFSLASLALLLVGLAAMVGGLVLSTLAVGAYSLRYALEEGGLAIRWLGMRTTIPYQVIDGIYRGDKLKGVRNPRWVSASGYRIGAGSPLEDRPCYFFTTCGREDALSIVFSEHGIFVLSPAEPAEFRRELIARIEASEPLESPRVEWRVPPMLAWLGDSIAQFALGLSLLVLLITAGAVFQQYSQMPPSLPTRYDELGNPTWISPREYLWWLPAFGAAALALHAAAGSWLAGAERVLARLLWLSTPVVEALILVAAIRLLP